MPSYMYILECADGSYYTGSTKDLKRRLWQHQNGEGANFTKKRLPVKLVYAEPFDRVEDAFRREKQIQGWSRRKKKALIEGNQNKLIEFSKNYTQYGGPASTSSASGDDQPFPEPVEGNTPAQDPASTSSASGVFQYTVAQLISVLQSMPQELPVLVDGYETGFENPHPVEIVKLQHQPENAYYDGEFQESDDDNAFQAVVLRRVMRG